MFILGKQENKCTSLNELLLVLICQTQVTFTVLNWVAVCTVRSATMKVQTEFLSTCLSTEEPHNLALILMPMFSYKKNMLWVTESQILQTMGHANIAFDLAFSLRFGPHVDRRDERPLHYRGRVASPLDQKVHTGPWRDTKLVTENQTDVAQHIVHFKIFEDLEDDALPEHHDSTTLTSGHISRSLKFQQLGPDGFEKLLSASVLQIKPSDSQTGPFAVLLVDLNCHVGDLALSFISRRGDFQMATHYLGVLESDREMEYVQEVVRDHIVELFVNGTLACSDVKPMPTTPPAEILLALPPPPVLNALEYANDPNSNNGLKLLVMPTSASSMWVNHSDPDVRKGYDLGLKDIKSRFDIDLSSNPLQEGKRGADVLGNDVTDSNKCQKRDDGAAVVTVMAIKKELVGVETLSGPVLQSCKIAAGRHPTAQLCIYANFIAITNPADEPVDIPKHTTLGLFGKGSFVHVTGGKKALAGQSDADPSKHIVFRLHDNSTLVHFQNKVRSVGEVVREKKSRTC